MNVWSLTRFPCGRTDRENFWTGLFSGGSNTLYDCERHLVGIKVNIQASVIYDLYDGAQALLGELWARYREGPIAEKARRVILFDQLSCFTDGKGSDTDCD
jgi:hypothetical protein